MATSTSPFLTWFSQWGQMIYIVVQMLFWAAIAVAALMIALQYRRFVGAKVAKWAAKSARAEAKAAADDEDAKGAATQISIEEFVE
ncbi:MAG TPA: hypothetical protein VFE45_12930 [Coriobacteriia bacterium]|nr:hypothetical protein [Coriobacteriia bacterium]